MAPPVSKVMFAAFAALFFSSCGDDAGDVAEATPPTQNGFEERSGDLFDDDSDKMLNRYAKTNPLMQNGGAGPASEGVNRQNDRFNGEIAKRDFAAKDYSKKSFWGTKEYAKKVYDGPLDGNRFMKNSRFNNANSPAEASMVSPESGTRYGTGSYGGGSGAARESNRSVRTFTDPNTQSRRNSYKQPKITDWRNQRNLSVDDTRSMLGRSD